MGKVDLITGVLGAGKTTFIKKYANYLLEQNKNVAIIVNDFGAINVDRLMFLDLENKGCHIESILGGNVCCDWMRRFKTKLITLSLYKYDHVIVEPSGIFDIDDFLDVMNDDVISNMFTIGSIISIVSDDIIENKYERYLLVNDISISKMIILSKYNKENLNNVIKNIYKTLDDFHTDKNYLNIPIITSNWNELNFSKINNLGYNELNHDILQFDYNEVFSSIYILNNNINEEDFLKNINILLNDTNFGDIIRIKGFINDHGWLIINATKTKIDIDESSFAQKAIIIIGSNLNEDKIKELFN